MSPRLTRQRVLRERSEKIRSVQQMSSKRTSPLWLVRLFRRAPALHTNPSNRGWDDEDVFSPFVLLPSDEEEELERNFWENLSTLFEHHFPRTSAMRSRISGFSTDSTFSASEIVLLAFAENLASCFLRFRLTEQIMWTLAPCKAEIS